MSAIRQGPSLNFLLDWSLDWLGQRDLWLGLGLDNLRFYTSVAAECRGSACSSHSLTFSIEDGLDSFYIEEVTGDVFLVSVGGSNSMASACPDSWCGLQVRARLSASDVSEDISLKIASIPETDILILDTNGPVSAVDTVIEEINSAQNISGKFWFRKLNVQPAREGNRNKADTDTLAFITALDIENEMFLDSGAAKDIIEYGKYLTKVVNYKLSLTIFLVTWGGMTSTLMWTLTSTTLRMLATTTTAVTGP